MKIRLYVDESSEETCDKQAIQQVKSHVQKEGYCYGHYMDCERVDGIMFGYDERGYFTEINTFVGGLPKDIKCFTFCLVTIYDEDLASMYNAPLSGTNNDDDVESVVDTFYNSSLPSKRQDDFWRIRISGPTFEVAVDRYKKIRAGEAIKDVWAGKFVANVTSLAEYLPKLLVNLQSLNSANEIIPELLTELRERKQTRRFSGKRRTRRFYINRKK